MIDALKRHRDPDQFGPAVMFFGLVASAGFAWGWLAQQFL